MIYLLIITLSLTLTGCDLFGTSEDDADDPAEPFERRELPRALSGAELQIVDGAGAFGFDMMHKLLESGPQESHFISPLSILMAYGMTMNGAEADTYTQMQEVFGLQDMSREEINQAARELIDLLTGFDDVVVFNIANSIWYRDTFSVEQDFLDTNQHYFDAAIEAADFDDPETVDRINQWVNDNTEGLIEEIVEGPIDPLTVMYLINAIYFNGEWTIQFDPDDTDRKPFHRPDGTTVEVDMMRISEVENMQYTSGEDYQAVNLYYGDAGYAMTLVLPDEETGLDNWLQNKTWDDWRELTGTFGSVTLNLEMPKFELGYEVDGFGDILQDLGIVDAFNPNISDFSRINPARDDLYISDTRHVTFIRVDEEGTEAAAATSVEAGITSAPQTVNLRFDRPYFYVIREVESGAILFMGTMTDPS
jgi:serine protease inhibitor